MNKKLLLILFSIFLLCSFTPNRLKTIRGTIKAYGNEPFVYPMVVAENDETFFIADGEGNFTREELLSLQGHLVEFKGYFSNEQFDKNKKKIIIIVEYYLL